MPTRKFEIYGLLTLALIFFSKSVVAQQIISGQVRNENNNPLSYASITVTQDSSSSIIAFAICDAKGNYRLSITIGLKKLRLTVTHVNYLKKELIVPNKTSSYNFILQESIKPLKDIFVKSPPIYEEKDTLNYNVHAFTATQDRVVGDVIRKLPGIEMRGDGIYYQGKRIQRYLIDGLNLLGNQYNLANDNLPVDAVKKIQVIEHDQPIKILDSLLTGQSPSLNLQLKKYTITGRGSVGAGLSPALWDANITPMIFHKKFQAINSLQSNNTGRDLSKFVPSIEEQGDGKLPLTGIQSLATPPFDKEKWLNNQANLISSSALQQLDNDWQVRLNLSYLNNHEMQSGNTQTLLFLPNETIQVLETQNNSYNTNYLYGNIVVEKNSKKNYFKDDFYASKKWDHNIGNLVNNGTNIYQNTSNNVLSLLNEFQVIKNIGKQLVNFNSKISYDISPQQLIVMPGQFDSVINDNKPYDQITQILQIKNFQADNYINLTKKLGNFTVSPKVGFLIQSENTNSYMTIANETEVQKLDSNYQNDIHFLKTDIYSQLNLQYKKNRWLIGVKVPVAIQHYYYRIAAGLNHHAVNRVTFEPALDLTYRLNPNLDFSFSSNTKNNFGSISQLYTGYILQTYRTLQRSNPIIPESSNFDNVLRLNYKDPIHTFFAGFSYDISHRNNNLLLNSTVLPGGSTTLSNYLQSNNQMMQLVNLSANKYFPEIKTSLKLYANTSFGKGTQIINGSNSIIKNNNYNINWNANYSPKSFFNAEYSGQLNYLNSKISGKNSSPIRLQEHHGEILFIPFKNQMLKIQGDYYMTNLTTTDNQFFLNMIYRFSLTKNKIDLELHGNNLLNTKYFTSIYMDAYSTIYNTFRLRPSQFLISVSFNFK